jgi:hypothetical protein
MNIIQVYLLALKMASIKNEKQLSLAVLSYMYSESCFRSAGEVDWKDAASPGGEESITRNKSLSQIYGRRTKNRAMNITSIEEDSFGTCPSTFVI